MHEEGTCKIRGPKLSSEHGVIQDKRQVLWSEELEEFGYEERKLSEECQDPHRALMPMMVMISSLVRALVNTHTKCN
jgi:hypothetical protein